MKTYSVCIKKLHIIYIFVFFRSMDELEPPEIDEVARPSVKELVARIQQQTTSNSNDNNNSESSDDEALRMSKKRGTMGDSNIVQLSAEAPRSRSGVYSPAVVGTALIDSNTRYIEPIGKIQESSVVKYSDNYGKFSQPSGSNKQEMRFVEPYKMQFYENEPPNPPTKYYEHNLNTRLAKLRVLDNSKNPLEGTSRMLDTNSHDQVDRDTNNDSGYSTKVYGSSKGNSPSLSGQIDGECLGASSLV